jgi:hypothetical protein
MNFVENIQGKNGVAQKKVKNKIGRAYYIQHETISNH